MARKLRYPADPNTLAEIECRTPDGRDVTLFGLVVNESMTGCAVVLVTDEKLRMDDSCVIKVGPLSAVDATVRWVNLLEKGIVKVGIEYHLP